MAHHRYGLIRVAESPFEDFEFSSVFFAHVRCMSYEQRSTFKGPNENNDPFNDEPFGSVARAFSRIFFCFGRILKRATTVCGVVDDDDERKMYKLFL